MKKILYIASSYGHIISFHIPYIKQLEKMGFIVHAGAAGASDNAEPQGTKKINLPFEKSMLSYKNISCTFQLMKLIKKERYDIISVHTSLAAFFVRLAVMLTGGEKPIVINTVHGYLFDKNSPYLKKYILLGAEKLTKVVTNILVVMNQQDYELAEKYHLYKDKLIKVPGVGIDTRRFSRENVEEKILNTTDKGSLTETDEKKIDRALLRKVEREKFGISDSDIVMIYAAEFSKRKNQKMLINAMAKLPQNYKLIFAGKGQFLEPCRNLAEELGLNEANKIIFLGHVKNLEYYYYLSDICVSSSRSEGLPFNIMEAMAMGLPIVATNVKGHEDLVEQGKNGYLYEFNDQQGFVNEILRLINAKSNESVKNTEKMEIQEQKNCNEMSQNNIIKAQQYGLVKVIGEVIGVYISE